MVSDEGRVKTPPAVFYTVRFRLQKDGPLMYISHLDFVRTMEKALVRTKLPLWYTLGFNPIPKIAFAAPLSVGIESDCELMDVRFDTDISPEQARTALSAQLMPHLQITDAYIPTVKFKEVGYIMYDISFSYDGISENDLGKCTALLEADEFIIEKTGKSGKSKVVNRVDIKTQIKHTSLQYCPEAGCIKGRWMLSATPSSFLSPMHILAEIKRLCVGEADAAWCQYVRRREIYDSSLTAFR